MTHPSAIRKEIPSFLAPASLALLGLVLVGCHETPAPAPLPPPTVEVKAVEQHDGARELRLSGDVTAERSLSLSFATVGTVQRVLVEQGQRVKKGQALAVVGQSSHKDSLGIARARAAQAEDAYRRLKPMYDHKTLPAIKMVEVETGREQARLSVSMARKRLADTVLRAPVAGVIARRNVEPGGAASPAMPAFTLVQTRTMLATAPVPEMQVAAVKPGDKARVKVAALGKSLQGTVREVGVIANRLTRTYDVKVALDNKIGDLRVGMIAEVYLPVAGHGSGLVVPPQAVRVDETGAPYVYVLGEKNTLQQRPVKIDRFVGQSIALASGVRRGERVITSGTPMLSNGMTVRVLRRVARVD